MLLHNLFKIITHEMDKVVAKINFQFKNPKQKKGLRNVKILHKHTCIHEPKILIT